MALKIPEAPNIVGGDAVLRSERGINGATTVPDFRIDTSAVQDSVKEIGSLLASVQQKRDDTMMADVSSEWIKNMDNHMNYVMDKYKGANAVNLYDREIKTYADKLNADLFGAPKDDGKVRIEDKGLQERFKQWANKQLVHYNAQIGHYEGKELERYNESTFNAREAQITDMLSRAETPQEIEAGRDSFLELQGVQFRGLNSDYIKQMAASKTDAAVVKNAETKIVADVNKGRAFVLNPTVQSVLSDSSKAALNKKIQEEWEAQGITAGGEGMAAGDNGRALKQWTDTEVLSEVYGTTEPEKINAIRQKIYGGAKKRSDALTKEAEGVADMIRGQRAGQLGEAKTKEDIFTALQDIYSTDQEWAHQVDASIQTDLELASKISAISKMENALPAERVKAQNAMERLTSSDWALDQSMLDAYGLSGSKPFSLETKKMLTDDEEQRLSEYRAQNAEVQEAIKKQSAVYADIMDDVVTGRYVGGADPRLNDLGWSQQQAIYQAVQAEQAYRNVANRYPEMDSVLKGVDTKYDSSAMSRAKRIMAEEVNKADGNGANRLDSVRLKQIANYAVASSRDNVSNALTDAITNTTSTEGMGLMDRVDARVEDKRNQEIASAGLSAFTSSAALKATKTSDNTYDKQTSRAKKVIRNFRNNLPEGYRSVVDDNEDLFIAWYRVGNTPAILNFVRTYTTLAQSGGNL